MTAVKFSTDHVDYLQRNNYAPPPIPAQTSMTTAPPVLRRLWHVCGVGQNQRNTPGGQSARRKSGWEEKEREYSTAMMNEQIRLPSEDILIGLAGFRMPVAFLVVGQESGVSINLGTWSQKERENASPAVLESRCHVVGTLLESLYPAVDMQTSESVQLPTLALAGQVLGVPSIKQADPRDGALPWDRLVRAMHGSKWAVLVLAEPVSNRMINNLRHALLNEQRSVQAAADATHSPSPLAKTYTFLLDVSLKGMSQGQAVGSWRTAVYLLGDESSYYRLASVWQSIFSGEASLPESVRVWESPEVKELAAAWALPDLPGPPPPGHFQHPFTYQTLLTSNQLAAYIHLPELETAGFRIELVPNYDIVPRSVTEGKNLSLGQVMDRSRKTSSLYKLGLNDISRHGLVAGVTGSGKTNTLFHILIQLWKQGVPFLVLEPAKTEYRSLFAASAVARDLRVFTLGQEEVSPLRINPFEVEPGVSIATHIDLLKSVFNASFGMWNPLPQVLERCLHTIYRDYGWDPVRGTNSRLTPETSSREQAFPTLTDLYYKVGEIVDSLGYEDRVTSDIKASLMTRLNSLRIGGKGVMLDTQRSIPMTELLSRPTVIELEPIGDDDEKAFLMGLLLIRLYEHRRVTGSLEGTGLNHVVVVEEAHRLLANVPPSSNQEQSNVRGKAVETFSNMLSEIRAYGEGFLVAEQIPSKLALDVIKNTNLKIVHRIVAGDDRQVLGETMNMAPQQREMLSTLRVGQAVVFSEGDDRPILVSVPYAKITVPPEMRMRASSDRVVGEAMSDFRRKPHIARSFVPFDRCPHACGEPYRYCEEARELVGRVDFQNQFTALVQSLAVDGGSPAHFAQPLAEFITARLPQGTAGSESFSCVVMNATRWYLASYGRYYGWNYTDQELMRIPLVEALLKILPPLARSSSNMEDFERSAGEFAHLYHQMCRRSYDPFPTCTAICPNGECLFRFQAQKLLGERHLSELFDESMKQAALDQWDDLIAIDQAISRLVSFDVPLSVQRSAGLCYGMQKIVFKPGLLEHARQMAVQRLVEGFDRRYTSEGEMET